MKIVTVVYWCLTVFVASLLPAASAQTFSVIHSFSGGSDGANPTVGVTLRGNSLFGTTAGGGIDDKGTVYQVTPMGSTWRTASILWFPTDNSGGYQPRSPAAFSPDGHLYGTTFWGGNNNRGVIFRLTPPLSICKAAACFWRENVVYNFTGSADGMGPSGKLSWDQHGNVYGTAQFGSSGHGIVYQLKNVGNQWTQTPIWTFSGKPDGDSPNDGVVVDASGKIFGTTSAGGQYGHGTVYMLSDVNGNWTETILHNFQNGNACDGELPLGGLTIDGSGNLYGSSNANFGFCTGTTIFELKRAGNTYTFQVLYNTANGGFQCGPQTSLALDATGGLYGTSECEGEFGDGNVFRLTNTENGWKYVSLHDFNGGDGLAAGESGVTIGPDGTLYGTTRLGGSQNRGTVWTIKP